MGKKWIQEALGTSAKGKLREKLGVKKEQNIPAGKLAMAAKAKGALGKEARLAETLKKLRKK